MAKKKAKKPTNRALPGMEDHAIPELERLAQQYASIRDQRMELNREEITLKSTALAAMKKHKRAVYHHDGITVTVVPAEEGLKVKVVKKPAEDEAAFV